MDLPIKNINDLREEIYRLKALEQEKSVALAQRFESPSAVFSTLKSLIPSSKNPDGTNKPGFFHQDLIGLISRFALPFTLNRTLFRNSGFVIKTLVGMVSQKASHFISEDSVTGVWDKVKGLFKGKTPQPAPAHKGVPPLSETY
jgi:hypothetical protein